MTHSRRQGCALRSRCCAAAARLIAVLMLMLAPAALAQEAGPRSIHGTVVDGRTHQPVARALVFSSDQQIAQLTDGEGRFSFELAPASQHDPSSSAELPPNLLILLARKPGYLSAVTPLLVTPEGSSSADNTLTLTPGAVIKGRITAPGTDTAAGVPVSLFRREIRDGAGRWAPMLNKKTNLRGEYRFADLEPGDYKLMTREWVEAPETMTVPGHAFSGCPPAFYADAADFASATRLHLRAGETVDADLTLRPQPYYPVRIPVANLAPGMFLDPTVGEDSDVSGFSLGFNQQTRRIEGMLPSGTYQVTATASGAQQAYGTTELTVAGGPADGAPLTLVRAGTLPVIVHEEFTSGNSEAQTPADRIAASAQGGEPPSNTPVVLSIEPEAGGGRGPNFRGAAAGQQGYLMLENVRPGRFRVTALATRGYVASLTSGGVDLLRDPLVIGPGGASAPIEVTLRDDTGTLEVTVPHVTMPPGMLQWETMLLAVPLQGGGGQVLQGAANAEGKFILPAPPGRYLLLAWPANDPGNRQNLEFRSDEAMAHLKSRGTVVTVAPRQQVHAEVPLFVEDAE